MADVMEGGVMCPNCHALVRPKAKPLSKRDAELLAMLRGLYAKTRRGVSAPELRRLSGRAKTQVRRSLSILIANGYVRRKGIAPRLLFEPVPIAIVEDRRDCA